MPRIAALIPADASENKEMPQRAGVAVIGAPVPSISFQVSADAWFAVSLPRKLWPRTGSRGDGVFGATRSGVIWGHRPVRCFAINQQTLVLY
jgi:hypothetical protein